MCLSPRTLTGTYISRAVMELTLIVSFVMARLILLEITGVNRNTIMNARQVIVNCMKEAEDMKEQMVDKAKRV